MVHDASGADGGIGAQRSPPASPTLRRVAAGGIGWPTGQKGEEGGESDQVGRPFSEECDPSRGRVR
jgi:hypothetical protein